MSSDLRRPYNPYRKLPEDTRSDPLARLINAEVDFMVPESYCDNEESKSLRQYAVRYIEELHLKNRGEKFDALIPYTAMTYFDRFCSGGNFPLVIGDTQIDLCLTCCLTVAWKLRTKTFNLPQFLVDKELPFTAEHVLNMELQICKRLKWRIRALTPFNFFGYYLQLLDPPPNEPSPVRPFRQLILTSQYDVEFTKYRPSVVAAAALLVVVSRTTGRSLRHRLEVIIRISKILNPHVNTILDCESKLEPLYRDPPEPAAEECPSSSSAEEAPPLGEFQSTLAEFKSDSVNPDELMNYELCWVEHQEKYAKSDEASGDDDAADTSYIAQRLTDCCTGYRQGCCCIL